MRLSIKDPEHASRYNAVTKDGEVVASGRALRYALSASPKAADFIADAEGTILAASVGSAWIPTREGVHLVTAAALALVNEALVEDDGTAAYENFVERFDPIDG